MSYAILAMHRVGEREVEICRVGNEQSANKIAGKLSAETYIDKLPDQARGRTVPR